ncbi:regucalcin [Biscogniauxia marginata]|nr:regucalcin [Biscogniauxia marginata]
MSTAAEPAIQQWNVTEAYLNPHCGLGEGPYYEAATNSLRFVDIKKHRVHSVNLDQGPQSLSTIQLDTPVGVTADVEGVDPRDKILIGAKYGIAVLDRKTGTYEYVARFEEKGNERLRSNDGAVDPHGRFWQGAMTDFGYDVRDEEIQKEKKFNTTKGLVTNATGTSPFPFPGHLYLFDGSGRPAQSMRHPVAIPNSVGWSPDGRTMYFTSSRERTVYAWDYAAGEGGGRGEGGAGRLSNERVFYRHEGPAEPDGFRVDTDGNLWHALYGGSRVLKISPAGEVVGQINLPTQNITCPQFVGTELFITTGSMEPGSGPDSAVELGGALFRVEVGARGLEPFAFKLDNVK